MKVVHENQLLSGNKSSSPQLPLPKWPFLRRQLLIRVSENGSPYLETKKTVKFNEANNGEKQNLFINHNHQCGEVWLFPKP